MEDDQKRVHELYLQAESLSEGQRRALLTHIVHTLMTDVERYDLPMAVKRIIAEEATVEEAAALYDLDVARLWAELARAQSERPRDQSPPHRIAKDTEVNSAETEWRSFNWAAQRIEQQQASFRRARTAAVGLLKLVRSLNERLGPEDLERFLPRFRFIHTEIQALERYMCHVCGVALPFDLAGIEAYYASEQYQYVCAACYQDLNPTEPTARRRLARLHVLAAERPDLVAAKLVVAQERLGLNDRDFDQYFQVDQVKLLRLALCEWSLSMLSNAIALTGFAQQIGWSTESLQSLIVIIEPE